VCCVLCVVCCVLCAFPPPCNYARYIYLVSSLFLDRSIRTQCDAFRKGLLDIVPKSLLRMFSEPELQVGVLFPPPPPPPASLSHTHTPHHITLHMWAM
jgi:hypothetical protein